ncbi:MAG: hypothetical protein ACLTGI_00480 [Hoylesella buccalis]
MTIIKDAAPQMFRYSIDECFCLLPDMSFDELKRVGRRPVSAYSETYRASHQHPGMAKTKTLAKAASRFAEA